MRIISIACVTAMLLVMSLDATAGGYGRGYRGYGGHGYHGYHGGGDAGYFVGGVLLGTLLTAPRRYYPPPARVVVVPQPTVVVPQPTVAYAPAAQAAVSRRLLRDINGNCFERKLDGQGTEMRVQLPAAACAW